MGLRVKGWTVANLLRKKKLIRDFFVSPWYEWLPVDEPPLVLDSLLQVAVHLDGGSYRELVCELLPQQVFVTR